MKILYIKNNSERNRAFQLRTTIYEENGVRFVKKEAITPEAVAHIENMKESYKKLSENIVDPNFKLVPIVAEGNGYIIFEFIDGESFEKKFENNKNNPQALQKLSDHYLSILNNSFKTTTFDHTTMVTDEMKKLFGKLDYSEFDGTICYDGICNIDMILSNLIEKDGIVYLIDYEWAYSLSLPVEYILHRTFMLLQPEFKTLFERSFSHARLYHIMERHFIDSYVMRDGFYFQKNRYMKVNIPITQHIKIKEENIEQLESRVEEVAGENRRLDKKLKETGKELEYTHKVIRLKDKQLEYFRLKNRVKNFAKKLIPGKQPQPFPTEVEEDDPTLQLQQSDYHYQEPLFKEEIFKEIENFEQKPLFSLIMPVYNVAPKWLDKAIKSVEKQWYKNWELCIVDDKSTNSETVEYLKSIQNPQIKVKFLEQNLNISGASNAAIAMAEGEYIVLMDNDDEITPDALYELAKRINETGADFIYSDEDFISPQEQYINPHFKPDFSPDLLLSHNYITHISCTKRELLDEVGYFNPKYDGAQDYELFLRITEKAKRIEHIPKVLYHWRMLESSTSLNSEAKPEALERGKKLLEETLERRSIDGRVELTDMNHYFRVRYAIKNNPLVSIIIPFKDKPELLDMCINSILSRSTYINYEIIGISNNSQEEATFEMMKQLESKDPRVKFYEYNVPFNYAQINNYAVANYAKGEHVLLLNNDIEVIAPEWIEAMLEHSQREEIGCVGAKLYYPNDTIQHAGIIMGLGGYAGHSHKMYPRDNPGYFNRLNAIQNVSAVTAACLMIKKSIYQEVDGMDEVKFKVAYNDVDFCLRVMKKGYRNLFTPYAELYHHESISRGYETTPEKIARFQTEKDALMERHRDILTQGDPYYNPNLTHDREDFSLR